MIKKNKIVDIIDLELKRLYSEYKYWIEQEKIIKDGNNDDMIVKYAYQIKEAKYIKNKIIESSRSAGRPKKVDEKTREIIMEKSNMGESLRKIANDLGISHTTVAKIINSDK